MILSLCLPSGTISLFYSCYSLNSSQMESLDLADVTNTYKQKSSASSKPLDRQYSISRIMKSGSCTYSTHWGTRLISCDCTEGFFDIQIPLTDDPLCKICSHSLSQHVGVSLTEYSTAGNLMSIRVFIKYYPINLVYRFT